MTTVNDLTKSQVRLLDLIKGAGDEGLQSSKKELASSLSCSTKTVGTAISRLRKEGFIEVTPKFLENGGQIANIYKIK